MLETELETRYNRESECEFAHEYESLIEGNEGAYTATVWGLPECKSEAQTLLRSYSKFV